MAGRLLTLVLAAAALAAAPAGARQKAAPAASVQKDWSRTVAKTAEGGYRMGNPDAPVKLVEYLSLTCPACADFSARVMPTLVANHVTSGRVSVELRNFVLNPIDLAAALLTRCAAPASYFPMTGAVLAQRDMLVGRIQALTPAQADALEALPEGPRLVRLAELSGLERLAAAYGLPRDKARQCLSDPAGLAETLALRAAGEARHRVAGTPTFLIDGRKVDVHDWAGLAPLLGPPAR